jgi:hypothetical protein
MLMGLVGHLLDTHVRPIVNLELIQTMIANSKAIVNITCHFNLILL